MAPGRPARVAIALACAIVLTLCTGADLTVRPPTLLVVGAQHLVAASDVERVAVGAPEVVDVRLVDGGRRVLLTGLAVGTTTLTVWTRRGEVTSSVVQVVARDPEAVRHELASLLAGIEGLSLRVAGDLVLLEGALHRDSDRRRVARIVTLYPQARDLTEASALLHRATASRLNRALASAGLAGLTARATGGRVVIEGHAGSPADLDRAGRIAATQAEGVAVLATVGIPTGPMIGLDVRFLELSRQSLAQVGIRWSEAVPLVAALALSTPVAGVGATTGGATLSASLTATLLALMREGRARLLANPRLVTRSGEPADFLAGGEIPIALVGDRQSSLTWRPYGILLECTPQADRQGRIAARLQVEVSTLDRANGVPEAPALATRRVRTTFTVQAGQTIALSGLLSADAAKDVQRLPGLGRIPILGELFKSRAWQSRETELVVFVTPTLAPPGTRGDAEGLREASERYRRAADDLRPRLDD